LVIFPNCKINLGLRIVGKRPDGYHDLDTVFHPLSLKDAAEINPVSVVKQEQAEDFELTVSGVPVNGSTTDNLCYKAWQLIKNDFPDLPPLKMHLLKAIPTGAGLGGGSSDGAFTLMLLNNLFQLGIPRERLIAYALQLGSDCPFFIVNRSCNATGRGEILEEIKVPLEDYYFILVHPGIHINTGDAFSKLSLKENGRLPLKEIVMQPVESWKYQLTNDFEEPVFKEHPSLKKIKEDLYEAGAVYASMTGTGSCIYGVFNNKQEPPALSFPGSYKVYHLKQCM
jgi:4-diphosphocytidyl-2-C-methyl-D-erythritol kinase